MDTIALHSATPTLDDAVRAVGCEHGQNAAAWWIQDTIGGRASGDISAIARRALQGIDDGDPAILDTLPTPEQQQLAGDSHWWADLHLAYEDGFQHGCHNAISAACQSVLA